MKYKGDILKIQKALRSMETGVNEESKEAAEEALIDLEIEIVRMHSTLVQVTLNNARRFAGRGEYEMAVFILKDMSISERAGIKDLLITMWQEKSCPKREVLDILDKLDELNKVQDFLVSNPV